MCRIRRHHFHPDASCAGNCICVHRRCIKYFIQARINQKELQNLINLGLMIIQNFRINSYKQCGFIELILLNVFWILHDFVA